jgi:hypothetical protein
MAGNQPTDAGSAAFAPGPVCATCGARAPGDEGAALARITWTRGVENGRDVWTCDGCSRTHLRSIEGKLDSAWW